MKQTFCLSLCCLGNLLFSVASILSLKFIYKCKLNKADVVCTVPYQATKFVNIINKFVNSILRPSY